MNAGNPRFGNRAKCPIMALVLATACFELGKRFSRTATVNLFQQDAHCIRLALMFTTANLKLEVRTGIVWTVKRARGHASEICAGTKAAFDNLWAGPCGLDQEGMAHHCGITEVFGADSVGNDMNTARLLKGIGFYVYGVEVLFKKRCQIQVDVTHASARPLCCQGAHAGCLP